MTPSQSRLRIKNSPISMVDSNSTEVHRCFIAETGCLISTFTSCKGSCLAGCHLQK